MMDSGHVKETNQRNAVLLIAIFSSFTATADESTPKAEEKPWTYRTQRLSRAQLDTLLEHPDQILIVDVRRPDEVSTSGGFPIYLSVQAAKIESSLRFIPKGRTIVTVSNRAHRAGAAGDVLSTKGYDVAGAIGTKDYEEQGGSVTRVPLPPPAGSPAPSAK